VLILTDTEKIIPPMPSMPPDFHSCVLLSLTKVLIVTEMISRLRLDARCFEMRHASIFHAYVGAASEEAAHNSGYKRFSFAHYACRREAF
jgi:hypothetical protein